MSILRRLAFCRVIDGLREEAFEADVTAMPSLERKPDGWIIACLDGGKIDWDACIFDYVEDAQRHIEECSGKCDRALTALPLYVGQAPGER
jgi:hypothetical protein